MFGKLEFGRAYLQELFYSMVHSMNMAKWAG